MKYLKIISITILLFIIMIIPVNANVLSMPDLPGEYEDYIIFKGFIEGTSENIYAVTFDKAVNMHVGTYEEFLNLYPPMDIFTHHSNDILYFMRKGAEKVVVNRFKLVGDEWDNVKSFYVDAYRYSVSASPNSIQKSDILYASKDVIDLADGSVFFCKGSWMKAAMARPMLGIIPYLIGLLIVLVAFSKGLQLLFRTLRKA